MADIFSEVEEELRRDKYNALLRRYGLPIAAAALIFILAVAAYQMLWVPMQTGRMDAASDRFEAALMLRDNGQDAAADAAFAEIVADDHDGYAALALMQRGDIAFEAGEVDRAAAYFSEAAAKADDDSFAGLARIKALYATADDASYGEILSQAEPLSTTDSPYWASAREVIAAAALRDGDLARARREYQYLSLAPETPQGIRLRAQEGLAAVDRAEPQGAAAAPAPEQTQPAEEAPE